MKQYKEYKDSGIAWIGDIPSHWEVKKLSQVSQEYFVSNKDVGHQNLLSLSYGNIIKKSIDTTEGLLPSSYDTYQVIKNGNIVLRLTDLQNDKKSLRVGLCTQEGIITSAYLTLSPRKNVIPKFLYLLLHTADIKKVFYGMGSGLRQNLNWKELRKLMTPLPPKAEQEAIVKYLDRKTEQINQYIRLQEQQIQGLQEFKQSIIARAVTRGLDTKAPLRPSGIAWIGDIPCHWQVVKMRHIFKLSSKKSETEEHQLLSLSQYTGITVKTEENNVGMFRAESTIGYNLVKNGQFVMNIMLAWNGSYALSYLNGVISPAYCVYDFIGDNSKEYICYLLGIKDYQNMFKAHSTGLIQSRLRLYPHKFLALPILLPPVEEQEAIVKYLDEKTEQINLLISKTEASIALMKEFKQSLIADAVTGRINVQPA